MDANPIKRDNAGPFYMSRALYKMGFWWQEEMQLQDGWKDVGMGHLPGWAKKAVGPYGGIVGEWKILRHRLMFHDAPVSKWLDGQPRYVEH